MNGIKECNPSFEEVYASTANLQSLAPDPKIAVLEKEAQRLLNYGRELDVMKNELQRVEIVEKKIINFFSGWIPLVATKANKVVDEALNVSEGGR